MDEYNLRVKSLLGVQASIKRIGTMCIFNDAILTNAIYWNWEVEKELVRCQCVYRCRICRISQKKATVLTFWFMNFAVYLIYHSIQTSSLWVKPIILVLLYRLPYLLSYKMIWKLLLQYPLMNLKYKTKTPKVNEKNTRKKAKICWIVPFSEFLG